LQGTDVMKYDEEQFRQNVRWAEFGKAHVPACRRARGFSGALSL
jgi:hypothetical protein